MLFNSPIFCLSFCRRPWGLYILLRQFAGPRARSGAAAGGLAAVLCLVEPAYLPLLGGIAVSISSFARWITAQRRAAGPVRPPAAHHRIAVDLMVLGYYKIHRFPDRHANTVLQTIYVAAHLAALGISFFTFQKIAYSSTPAREVASTTFSNIAFS